jgi:hypothetical protein
VKSDLWVSLLSSGDLKYVSDPVILDSLSSSYFFINRIKELEKVYYDPNIYMQLSGDNYTGKRAVDTVEILRPEALEQVTQTNNIISEFLNKVTK